MLTPLYFINYIHYFFYLGFNWNFRLAAFVMYHEIAGEKKYGLHTTGIDDLTTSVSLKDRQHASIYQPVNFYTAEKLFAQLTPADKSTSFLDVGCGMGRLLAMAAHHDFHHIYGVDFSPKLCHEAVLLAEALNQKFDNLIIEIDCMDAIEYIVPDDVSVIFLFNPFDDLIMQGFIKQLQQSIGRKPRPVKVLYANPQCKDLFLNAGFEETFSFKKMYYLEGAVMVNTIK